MSVLVVGDTNVDLEIRLPDPGGDAAHANPDPRMFGGGSAANTAAALARLDVACTFVGTVGDDSYGRFSIRSLRETGVDITSVTSAEHEPTVTVIAVVKPDGDRLIYVWPPEGGAHTALEPVDAVSAVKTNKTQWLHVSGICLRRSPARDALLAAMTEARAMGIPVSFDLNLRLENWGWDDDFRDIVMRAVESADVVLGSAADEVVPLTGHSDPIDAAGSLADSERTVVARLGRHGALAASPEGVVDVPGFNVAVADTLGAGDSFNAGFIQSRISGGTLTDALRRGNAVAALTIMRSGARSTPSQGAVAELLGTPS